MTIIDIVSEYLKENGYDGIYNSDGECACCLEDGLRPCGEDFSECKPGYKVKYEDLPEEKKAVFDSSCDWYIMKEKVVKE